MVKRVKSFLRRLLRRVLGLRLPPVPELAAAAAASSAASPEVLGGVVEVSSSDLIEIDAEPVEVKQRFLPGTSFPLVSLAVCAEEAPTVPSLNFEKFRA